VAHDVFLSYSNKDKAAADAVCHALERNGIRVWMAPRDILAGVGWAQSIIGAINGARVMVLVFSGNANASPQIEREVERAVHKGVPVVPIRIENVPPSEALEYFISAPHWLDAFTPPFEQHVGRLADAVKRLLESEFVRKAVEEPRPGIAPRGSAAIEPEEPKLQAPESAAAFVAQETPEPPAKKSSWLGAAAVLAVVAAAGGGALVMGRGDNPAPKTEIASVAASAPVPAATTEPSPVVASTPTPVAEKQQTEFDEAIAAGTVEALDDFMAKNPSSPLTKTAKRERERISPQQAASMPPVKLKSAPVTECDRLAADPDDADRAVGVNGVAYFNVDVRSAVAACAEAIQKFPGERRLFFQYGRLLKRVGRDAEARTFLLSAADAGSVMAMEALGSMYLGGQGGAKDEAEGVRLYRKAADGGNAQAMIDLGNWLREGKFVAKDEAEAARLYRKAADLGKSAGMAYLGFMYENGLGVVKNEATARKYYRLTLAAFRGDVFAMDGLRRLSKAK
jgi:hypothetical protein